MKKSIFAEALELVLKFEGGYTNNPNDSGGPTNYGITQSVFDSFRKERGQLPYSVKKITKLEVSAIYFQLYWLKGKCDKMEPEVAIFHFDTCVNLGVRQANKLLQRCIGAKDDGLIGDITLQQMKQYQEDEIIIKYIKLRKEFYEKIVLKNSKLNVFLNGWMNRVNELVYYLDDRSENSPMED